MSLPVKSGGQTVQRGYVYSLFIERATSIAEGAPGDAVRELLRGEIRNALKTWSLIIGSVQLNQAGELASGDGKLALSFPTGAVSATVDIVHTPLSIPNQQLPAGWSGQYHFELEAFSGTGDEVTQFSQPYTMRVGYNAAALNQAGLSPHSLRLVFWDGGEWATVPSSVDTASQRIVATLDHFGEFALVSGGEQRVYLPLLNR